MDRASAFGALTIPGTWNARDIGGRAAPKGAQEPLRTGVLLRTASLSRLADEGVRALEDLGVSLVLDLRGPAEIARDGRDRPGRYEVTVCSMDPSAAATSADPGALLATMIGADDPAAGARRLMINVYAQFVRDPAIRASVGSALTAIARNDRASVVHCSAGKDRTGWIVALVQYLCGVPDEERVDEYLASMSAAHEAQEAIGSVPGLAPEALTALLGVDEAYLASAWSCALSEFGSIDEYVAACGVDGSDRENLVSRLVGATGRPF